MGDWYWSFLTPCLSVPPYRTCGARLGLSQEQLHSLTFQPVGMSSAWPQDPHDSPPSSLVTTLFTFALEPLGLRLRTGAKTFEKWNLLKSSWLKVSVSSM